MPAAARWLADARPNGQGKWTYEGVELRDQAIAALTGMLVSVHALARVLANSEAFRGSESNQDPLWEQRPLDASITEVLFAALYFLSEQAQEVAEELLDTARTLWRPLDLYLP